MTHLLDAQALIWSQEDPNRLGPAALLALQDPANDLAVGIETIWELGIKTAIGKLTLNKAFRTWIDTAIADLGLAIVPIRLDHIDRHNSLPFHHRDPFDRLLIAQSLVGGIPVVSSDAIFDAYGVARVWN